MKKIIKFAIDNYFLSIFVIIIVLVGIFSLYKIAYAKSSYIYVKVKLGQGLWWAGGTKPSIWLANSIKKGDFERDFTGKTTVEVIEKRYYPWWGSDQFDVYLTLRLKVGVNKNSQKYTFKRSTIGVGSPIELELSSAQISGTIIELSEKKFENRYTEKTVLLTKKSAFPWEYNAIITGDKYFDGEDNIFEVIDKKSTDTASISFDSYGNSNPSLTELKKYIHLKAKIKVQEKNGQFVFGEDQVIHLGKTINISTPNFTFNDYFVAEIK